MKSEIIEVAINYGRTFNLGNYASKRIDLTETYQVTLEEGDTEKDLREFELEKQTALQTLVENEMYED